MGFETRKKGKYAGAEKFIEKMKEIQKEVKAALGKAQADMKKYADKKRSDKKEYKVRDLVMLSTKDLKYQMIGRRTEKLMERFVGLYKVKKIISSNVVELELPSIVKIHPVVNISVRGYPRTMLSDVSRFPPKSHHLSDRIPTLSFLLS